MSFVFQDPSTIPPYPIPLNVEEKDAGIYKYDLAHLKANKVNPMTTVISERKNLPTGHEVLFARALSGDLEYIENRMEDILDNNSIYSGESELLNRNHLSFEVLGWAIHGGQAHVVNSILNKVVSKSFFDINHQSNHRLLPFNHEHGSLLHVLNASKACTEEFSRFFAIFSLLVKAGADVNRKGKFTFVNSPFLHACLDYGHSNPSKLLLYLDNNANPLQPLLYKRYNATGNKEISEGERNKFLAAYLSETLLEKSFTRDDFKNLDIEIQVIRTFINRGFENKLLINEFLMAISKKGHENETYFRNSICRVCEEFDSIIDYTKWMTLFTTFVKNRPSKEWEMRGRKVLKIMLEVFEERVGYQVAKETREICNKFIEVDLMIWSSDGCFATLAMLPYACGWLQPTHVIQEEDLTILEFKRKLQAIDPQLAKCKLEKIKLCTESYRKDFSEEQNYMQDDQLLSYYEFLQSASFITIHLF